MKRCWPAASRSPGVSEFAARRRPGPGHRISRDVPRIFAAKVPLFPYFGLVAAIMPHSLPGEPRQGSSAPVTFRVELSDGLGTTVHLAAYDLRQTERSRRGAAAGRATRVLVRPLRCGGSAGRRVLRARERAAARRAAPGRDPVGLGPVHGALGRGPFVRARRGRARCGSPAGQNLPLLPRGDLLQAGPLLVEQGQAVVRDGVDPEGFSAGSEQFDSDITATRHPRAALGVKDGIALSLTCDGRTADDAGLTLGELAELMAALGAQEAINLDGGGSATQLCGSRMVNRPRELDGTDIPGGRPICTALAFTPRAIAAARRRALGFAGARMPMRPHVRGVGRAQPSTLNPVAGGVGSRCPSGSKGRMPASRGGKRTVSPEDMIGIASEEIGGLGAPGSADRSPAGDGTAARTRCSSSSRRSRASGCSHRARRSTSRSGSRTGTAPPGSA